MQNLGYCHLSFSKSLKLQILWRALFPTLRNLEQSNPIISWRFLIQNLIKHASHLQIFIHIQLSGMLYQEIDHHQNRNVDSRPVFGNNIVICNPQCMLGPHYYLFIPTFLLVSGLLIALYVNVKDIVSPTWNVVIIASITILIISYLLVGFSNPGIVTPRIDNQIIDGQLINPHFCEQCRVIRTRGTRHCKQCNCCILGYDHHCPWIGKCVGQQNKGRFYFFLLMMFTTLILFFIGTISTSASRNQELKKHY